MKKYQLNLENKALKKIEVTSFFVILAVFYAIGLVLLTLLHGYVHPLLTTLMYVVCIYYVYPYLLYQVFIYILGWQITAYSNRISKLQDKRSEHIVKDLNLANDNLNKVLRGEAANRDQYDANDKIIEKLNQKLKVYQTKELELLQFYVN